jgi:hypothetical protein
MLSIAAVLGPHQFGLRIWQGAQGCSQSSTDREDFAGGNAVPPMLCECLEIALSDFEAKNATVEGDCLRQIVEIAIGGVPTLLQIRLMRLFMSLSRILLQGSILTKHFNPVRHQVNLRKVDVSI